MTSPQPEVASCTILIADDSASDRLLLHRILREQGHRILEAVDGLDAVAVFERERPQIVLLDALMPNMDGFETARRIKLLAGEDLVPIIFLTSLQDAGSLARCLDAGGDDFLSKPYNKVILQAKINAFVRMSEMHKIVRDQRDEIAGHNAHLLHQQDVAKKVFDRVAHAGCLNASNIQVTISPAAVFNGDIVLAGVSPTGNLTMLLGDFTGHGLDAAIGAMPLAEVFYNMLKKGFSLRDIIREINLKLCNILPVEIFCCAFFAEFDFNNRRVQVWNGGLPDCLIYRAAENTITMLPSRNLPLGIVPLVNLKDSIELHEVKEGDRLYAWSDGIIEACNRRGEMFSEQRLLTLFQSDVPAQELFAAINTAVMDFIDGGAASDDISLCEITVVAPESFNVAPAEEEVELSGGPDDWSLRYNLQQEAIREFDPLPQLLQVLMQVPYLRQFGGQVFTVLSELYSNAVDHGILRLDSSIKNQPGGFSQYYRMRKQGLAALADDEIVVTLDYDGTALGGMLKITVKDSGPGFNYVPATDEPIRDLQMSGRGIHLVRSLCHSVNYFGVGNEVCATFLWGKHNQNTALVRS